MTTREQTRFRELNSEINLERLPVQGTIPTWLSGRFYRNGPAKFTVGDNRFNHLFDGLAMLHGFTFQNGQVSYVNRFLRSQTYLDAVERGQIRGGFGGTRQNSSEPANREQGYAGPNANVSIAKLGGHLLALTEAPDPVEFEPQTLATLGVLQFENKVGGQWVSAHPHYDFVGRELINYSVEFGRQCAYNIFRVRSGSQRQDLIASIPVAEPAYMHSFAITENYVVLVEGPFVVNPLDLMTSGKPFVENYRWEAGRGTRFIVVNRHTGQQVGIYQSEAFFSFHQVNAYEEDNRIVLDLAAFPSAAIVGQLGLDKVNESPSGQSELRRCVLRLDGSGVEYERFLGGAYEFPAINYRQVNTWAYNYAYGVAGLEHPANDAATNRLVKVDMRDKSVKSWSATGCAATEPVFVPAPEAQTEDEGVIVALVNNSLTDRSFLLVLDSPTFEEVGRAELPHFVPFGFHGLYVG